MIRPPFTKDQLQKMLVREDELRLCPETQAAYAEAERSWRTDWMQVPSLLGPPLAVSMVV